MSAIATSLSCLIESPFVLRCYRPEFVGYYFVTLVVLVQPFDNHFHVHARFEIIEAIRSLVQDCGNQDINPDQITEDWLTGKLSTEAIPDPDLIIRTAGEQRLSNFLLWQAAYSELYFCSKLWPDFGESDLEKALADFRRRTRKFGALACATGTSG